MRKPEDIARRMAEARNKAGNEGKKPVLMADLQPASEPKKAPALPAITENDLNFAKDLIKQYEKIPFDPLCQLVKQIRHDLRKYPEDFKAGIRSMDLNFWDLLCSNDIELTAVTIESNKGQIRIPASSKVFEDFFIKAINKLKAKRPEVTEVAAKEFETSLNYIVFKKTWLFFKNTDLGPHQKEVATGLTLQYFNLFELQSIAEYNQKPKHSEKSYKHYLSKRVEVMRKSTPL